MGYETILFDLDGTLTDSAPGIVNGACYAMERMGFPAEDPAKLRRFVGPPLYESIKNTYGLSDQDCWRAIALFREYYNDKGWLENGVYPGIPELLRDLRAAGKTLLVATSKPDVMARRVLEHFDLTHWFHRIEGADLNEGHCQKAAVIRKVLTECQPPFPAVMVGDRENDCHGAAENGLPAIGVLYGYGDRRELEAAGAAAIAPTVEDLRRLLLGE